MTPSHIVIIGEPVEKGLKFVGFSSYKDACAWAAMRFHGQDFLWRVQTVITPEEAEDQ